MVFKSLRLCMYPFCLIILNQEQYRNYVQEKTTSLFYMVIFSLQQTFFVIMGHLQSLTYQQTIWNFFGSSFKTYYAWYILSNALKRDPMESDPDYGRTSFSRSGTRVIYNSGCPYKNYFTLSGIALISFFFSIFLFFTSNVQFGIKKEEKG